MSPTVLSTAACDASAGDTDVLVMKFVIQWVVCERGRLVTQASWYLVFVIFVFTSQWIAISCSWIIRSVSTGCMARLGLWWLL